MATPIPKNDCEFSLAEAQRATGGRLVGDGNAIARGVCTDSRIVEPRMLFVALSGERFDGHKHVARAMASGAAAAIVAKSHDEAVPRIEVGDTLVALGDLARNHLERLRKQREIRSVAIGGASGKTTTKELTAAALRALFGKVMATPGNLNNRIGVPMTLFTLKDRDRAMVIECGTNKRGEIEKIASIVAPDVAMVLNVDIEHTEGLGSIEAVADEEAALFGYAREAIVWGADEPLLKERLPQTLRAISFGQSEASDVRVVAYRPTNENGGVVGIQLAQKLLKGESSPGIEVALQLAGSTSALNCAAALAATIAALGRSISYDELKAMSAALGQVPPVEGRMVILRAGSIKVIDDSYNANPRSVRAALRTAREMANRGGSRLVVALGDMLELGDLSRESHHEMIADVADANPAVFIAVGPCTGVAAIESADMLSNTCEVVIAEDSSEAAMKVSEIARPGDLVLIKGSRGVGMEALVTRLKTPSNEPSFS